MRKALPARSAAVVQAGRFMQDDATKPSAPHSNRSPATHCHPGQGVQRSYKHQIFE